MREWLMEFLHGLEEATGRLPEKCHHAMSFAKCGSDADGWRDELAIHVMYQAQWHTLFLDEDDFKKTPAVLIADVMDLVKKNEIESREP